MREIAIQAGHLQLIRSAFPIEGIAWKLKGRRLGDNAACCFKVTGVCAEKRCVVVALGILRDKPTSGMTRADQSPCEARQVVKGALVLERNEIVNRLYVNRAIVGLDVEWAGTDKAIKIVAVKGECFCCFLFGERHAGLKAVVRADQAIKVSEIGKTFTALIGTIDQFAFRNDVKIRCGNGLAREQAMHPLRTNGVV